MTKINHWTEFYHVRANFVHGGWQTLFKTGNPTEARDYARDKISWRPEAISRIEIRDYFGATVIETVWDSSWT